MERMYFSPTSPRIVASAPSSRSAAGSDGEHLDPPRFERDRRRPRRRRPRSSSIAGASPDAARARSSEPLHRVQAREEREQPALRVAIAGDLPSISWQRSIASATGVGPNSAATAYAVAERSAGGASPASRACSRACSGASAARPKWQAIPCVQSSARHARARPTWSPASSKTAIASAIVTAASSSPALGVARAQLDEEPDELRVRDGSPHAEARLRRRSCPRGRPAHPRNGRPGAEPRRTRGAARAARAPPREAGSTARPRRFAAAGTSPRANARRPAAARRREAVGADLAPAVVERAELREVTMSLLEVVAEDLLVLRRTLAIARCRPTRRTRCGSWPARA